MYQLYRVSSYLLLLSTSAFLPGAQTIIQSIKQNALERNLYDCTFFGSTTIHCLKQQDIPMVVLEEFKRLGSLQNQHEVCVSASTKDNNINNNKDDDNNKN